MMMNAVLYFVLLMSLATTTSGFAFFNRTDPAGVQYVDPAYSFYVSRLRPALERLHPRLEIWLNGVIGDHLAAANGFTKIISDGNRFLLLRKLIRSRILRLIVLFAVLKLAKSFFVIIVLPNIYFLAMTMME